MTVELERLAHSESNKPSRPRSTGGAPAGTAPALAPPGNDQAEPNRTLSYVLGGAAVALGGAALGIRLHNDARHQDWRRQEAGLPEPGSELTPADRAARGKQDQLRSSIETWDTVALGAGIAAGVSLGAAAIVWLSLDGATESTELALGVSPTGILLRSGF